MEVLRQETEPTSAEAESRPWTFLTNHAAVLIYIAANPDAKVREIADAVGLMERGTVGIISDLRHSGYIQARRVGRRNHYSLNLQMPLRRPYHAQSTVQDLVEALHRVTKVG